MFYIVHPANVMRYFEIVKPIITFDLLPSDDIRDAIFTIDYEKQREFQKELLDQMEDLGYQTHNSIAILGSLWIYISYWVIKLAYYFIYLFIFNTWFASNSGKNAEGGESDTENEGGDKTEDKFEEYAGKVRATKGKLTDKYDDKLNDLFKNWQG
jgi:ATP-dependent Zn protease